MTTNHSFRTGRVAAVAAALAALTASLMSVAASEAAPARPASRQATAAASLPSSAAPRPAAMHMRRASVPIDLYAVAGSTTMYPVSTATETPTSIPVWGYNFTGAAATQPGGPTIDVNQGDVVTITLHNTLPEATSLLLQGQAITPDTVGAAAGSGTKTYTFTASKPGTFLYEAGFIGATGGTEHQVALGLYGALVVRPTALGQAYESASSAYNDEGLLVLGEIDPALNKLAAPTSVVSPTTFDMRKFAAKYFTINGKAYSATDSTPALPITAAAGDQVLLRYVNAGMSYHSMSLLGSSQQIIGYDGLPLTYPHRVVAETFGPGQTVDALVSIPAATSLGSKFAVYDGNLMLNNSSTKFGKTSSFGGMLTFITVGTAGGSGPDTVGPSTTNVTVAPTPTTGSVDVNLSASISDVASGNSNVSAAEFFVDATGANGSGTPMAGTFGSSTAAVNATILSAAVASLSSGAHTIYVHGLDDGGNWGSFAFATLNLDNSGPSISLMSLTPNPSNGTANVAVHATASDVATGGGTIAAAEYTIDGGAPTPMTINVPASAASVDATIAAATVNALSDGSHAVAVRAQDSLGTWGSAVSIDLVVDMAGPVTNAGSVSASPTVTNGVNGYNSSVAAVRIFASATDGPSNVAAIEGFIDNVGANGSGFLFFPAGQRLQLPHRGGLRRHPVGVDPRPHPGYAHRVRPCQGRRRQLGSDADHERSRSTARARLPRQRP